MFRKHLWFMPRTIIVSGINKMWLLSLMSCQLALVFVYCLCHVFFNFDLMNFVQQRQKFWRRKETLQTTTHTQWASLSIYTRSVTRTIDRTLLFVGRVRSFLWVGWARRPGGKEMRERERKRKETLVALLSRPGRSQSLCCVVVAAPHTLTLHTTTFNKTIQFWEKCTGQYTRGGMTKRGCCYPGPVDRRRTHYY